MDTVSKVALKTEIGGLNGANPLDLSMPVIIAPMSCETFLWGRMSAARPIPVIDGLLAATAKTWGMTLVTRNASNVEGLGASVQNPFEA